MDLNLSNKVAIVTGGSYGIGAAIAIKLSEEGVKVVITGRKEDKLRNVSEICTNQGGKSHYVVADIMKENDIKKIVTETISTFGKLDILVNNAGVSDNSSILDATAMDTYDRIMATNLRGPVYLTHLAVKHLVESKGNIVNISSIAGMKVVSNRGFAYSTSKASLDHFSRSIALELAPKGVRVNVINPGPVRSGALDFIGLNEDSVNEIWDSFKSSTALGRIGAVEEIADLVAFVVSDKARSITGANLVSDNGTILKGPINMQN